MGVVILGERTGRPWEDGVFFGGFLFDQDSSGVVKRDQEAKWGSCPLADCRSISML